MKELCSFLQGTGCSGYHRRAAAPQVLHGIWTDLGLMGSKKRRKIGIVRRGRVADLLMMSGCATCAEGAASLRFLQERAGMLPTQLLSVLHTPGAHAFQVPVLCRVRKGRCTHCVYGAGEVKNLGHSPVDPTTTVEACERQKLEN